MRRLISMRRIASHQAIVDCATVQVGKGKYTPSPKQSRTPQLKSQRDASILEAGQAARKGGIHAPMSRELAFPVRTIQVRRWDAIGQNFEQQEAFLK